jgi:hypothetical protein
MLASRQLPKRLHPWYPLGPERKEILGEQPRGNRPAGAKGIGRKQRTTDTDSKIDRNEPFRTR